MQGFHNLFYKSKKQTTVNRGLMPDIGIQYSIEDIIEKKDLHMAKVEEILLQNIR
jgi:hypothetical protein